MFFAIVHKGVVAYSTLDNNIEGYRKNYISVEDLYTERGFILPTQMRSIGYKELFNGGDMELLKGNSSRSCMLITVKGELVFYQCGIDEAERLTVYYSGMANSKELELHCNDIEYNNMLRMAIVLSEEHQKTLDPDTEFCPVKDAVTRLASIAPFPLTRVVFTTVDAIVEELKNRKVTKDYYKPNPFPVNPEPQPQRLRS